MFYRHVFGNISGGFRGISRFLGDFAGPRPSEISEALDITLATIFGLSQCTNNYI